MTEGITALGELKAAVSTANKKPGQNEDLAKTETIKPSLIRPTENINKLHQIKSEEEVLEENASGRLRNFFSRILKWTSHKAMFAGLGAAGLGYLVHSYLAIPGLLVGIPAGIIHFITPKSKDKVGQSFADSLNTIIEAAQDPAQLNTFPDKFKKLFDSLVYQVEKMAPHQAKSLKDKILSPNDYSPKVKDKMHSVQESLSALINQLGIKVDV